MDAKEVLAITRKDNPTLRFAISKSGDSIGVWNKELGRYQTCLERCINGKWVYTPAEILVNGKPMSEYA